MRLRLGREGTNPTATLLPDIHHYSSNEPRLSLAEPPQLATFNNDGL
jgi:hypothetical protein